jgi:hypothetical protein
MIDIKEHGGNFGSATKLTTLKEGKILKPLKRVPFSYAGGSGNSMHYMEETKSYLWWVYYTAGSTWRRHIVRMAKNDPLDYKTYIETTYVPTAIIPLYDEDKLVVIYGNNSVLKILNSSMALEYNGSFGFPDLVSLTLAYRYKNKTLHLVYSLGNANKKYMKMDLANTAAPAILINVTVAPVGDWTRLYVIWEEDNDAFRYLSCDSSYYVNNRYKISDGSLIASYTNISATMGGFNYKLALGNAYNKIVAVIASDPTLKIIDINTSTVIASKTLTALRAEIQAKFPVSINQSSYPISYCRKLPNGKYVGLSNVVTVLGTGGSQLPEDQLFFAFDDNLAVTDIDYASYDTANFYGGGDPKNCINDNKHFNYGGTYNYYVQFFK